MRAGSGKDSAASATIRRINMSYWTTVEGHQIFGNNECPEKWIDYLISKGIEMDEDCCYDGELDDFMEALTVIEEITLDLYDERAALMEKLEKENSPLLDKYRNLYDWSTLVDAYKSDAADFPDFHDSLFDRIWEMVYHGYGFLPYQFYLACEDKIEPSESVYEKGHLRSFKLKEGQTIRVHAG
jgi:hypothetical protein